VPLPTRRIASGFLLLSLFSVSAHAQSELLEPGTARIVDESRRVVLHGTVHPLAQPQNDRGAVPDSFPAERMIVMLQRSADREQALQKFLRDVHTPGSPSFHHWVTPSEFGAKFGASDADIATISNWLQSHGFRLGKLASSKLHLEFSGTAAQVREALQTEIHEYNVEGKTYYAIAREASVPEQIRPLVRGFAPLNTFPLTSYIHVAGKGTLTSPGHLVKPQFTQTGSTSNFYAVAPEDFATQYNLGPLYAAGTNGTGQIVGILGESNIDLGPVTAYRQLFGLSGNNTQVVIDGEDPSDGAGPNIEGFLDVEVSGAVAPKATINFYIAGGTHFQSPLVLATMRALEDNQASVLSASFGECEAMLGTAGNQLWSGFWEQAAAQGQTVVVASGDTGPASCPLLLTPGTTEIVDLNPAVNGLASSSWNIAVGGTDFYYSDYASGAPSITSDWNQNNDASNGSLKAPLPEQPWDNLLGFNAVAVGDSITLPSPAGGGGASNCSVSTVTPPNPPTCTSGYPKPAWQNAPGVPADGVRDLPDVSLFAANGQNYSAYAICDLPGDCSPSGSVPPQVLLVGGTSASTPAMAGIMALVNQKYGRQGQADFTIYALARQQPSVFHDISLGTNDTVCGQQTTTCNVPTSVPPFLGLFSYGVYAAAPGYDMATGIGSFDANAFVTNWNKITYEASSTALQISPASIVHGSPVNVTTMVKASSGASVPTGDVDVQLSAPAQLPALNGLLQLAGGTASGSISTFPGGTYQVTAQYAGDGVFAPSTSLASTLTVTPEPSVTQLTLQYQALQLSVSGGIVQNGAQAPFGSFWTFSAQPTGQVSNSTAAGTGTILFSDAANSVQVPLSSSGIAYWAPNDLALGSHSVTANYSGDPSYNASTSTPLTFTVVKGSPLLRVGLDQGLFFMPGVQGQYQAGAPININVFTYSGTSLNPPTGNVSVTLGSTTQTAPLQLAQYPTHSVSAATVTFTNVPAGTYNLNASYAGDSNWNAASYTAPNPLTFANFTPSASTLSVSVSPSTVNSGQSVTFTVTLQGTQAGLEGGPVNLSANGSPIGFVNIPASPSTPNSATGSATLPAGVFPAGALQIVGYFAGSPLSLPSTSAPVRLTVNPTDFQMNFGVSRLSIKSGSSGTAPLQLTGPNSGSVSLQLACATSSTAFTCSINPSAPNVSGTTTATVTINAYIMSSNTAQAQPLAAMSSYSSAAVGVFFGVLFLLLTPRKRIRSALLMLLLVCATTVTVASCAGGGSSTPPPPPPPPTSQQVNTPTGSYSVVVTATSPSNTHNVKLSVYVQ
jgi:subtilase family serine protease